MPIDPACNDRCRVKICDAQMSRHEATDVSHSFPPPLPLAVHVGFSGSRALADASRADSVESRAWSAELRAALQRELERLPDALALSSQHFIVGLSQLAIGADTLFTESLQQLQWPQRLFLPQARAEFLRAEGSQGPDFLPHERERAEALFGSTHVVEEAVVGGGGSRAERFEETNLRILGESDLLICLRANSAPGKTGGTQQLLERAAVRGVPVLELVIGQDAQGLPALTVKWHRQERFSAPGLPAALATIPPLSATAGLPTVRDYAERLKENTSVHAGRLRGRFTTAAAVIVGTHVFATFVAGGALKAHHIGWIACLVVVELGLLGYGLWTHLRLHHRGGTTGWALTRLCAEVGRSVLALDGIPGALQTLQSLPFPRSLAPMLRTLTVLQLARESFLAIAAVALKLAFSLKSDFGLFPSHTSEVIAAVFGVCAVALPVLAVGAISLASAFDLEARASTFHEMHEFLQAQVNQVAQASSSQELAALAATIEARLLGETLTWYSRRAFTSVA
ncbi:MAG: hypothetical protein HY020_23305 [Burkholderiales bacterium]|nr:hypothetical protein [Burkholderiales bacterium]